MSYPHYPRTPSNIASYPSNMAATSTVGQSTAPPPLTIIPSGTTVLAYYQDYAWYFGVIQNYNLTRSGTLIYQILFRSGEIRSVASSQVLNQQSNNQNIEIGSRVVVQHPTKSMFISSLVAELPATENNYRYLLFLDDGSACYKTKDKLWVINLVENPILMLPPVYKSFIQRYFTMPVSTVKLINLSSNDSVTFTNYDNTTLQFSGKVAEVDCSIAKIRYSIPNGGLAEEWIHRGSSRILSFGHSHNPYYSEHSNLKKINGSSKQLTNQELDDDMVDTIQASDHQKFTKSPLKGKPFMVTPSLDPFMFSEDESSMPSVSKSGKYTTFNSWPVSDNTSSRNNTYGSHILSPKNSTLASHPLPQSPILILDESPINDPPPYSSPKHNCSNNNPSPAKKPNKIFSSPEISSPNSCNPVSVFSWSAPEESGARRHLDMSPKINLDVEFDFADTILNTAVNSSVSDSPPQILNAELRQCNVPFKTQTKEEIVVIDDEDDDDNDDDNLPPLVIETESKKDVLQLDETQLQVKDSFKSEGTSRNVPMILHQEACIDNFPSESTTDTSHQNGNVIEVVVHSSHNGEAQAFISVTPSIEIISPLISSKSNEEPVPVKVETKIMDSIVESEIKDEKIFLQVSHNSRKRRKISPLKSPKIAIPKMKINLKALNESSKELAAQKCVKRARKQQSKECTSKDTKHALSEKKKKIAKATELKMNSLLIAKKDQIKLNPEAKIARWLAPWFAKTSGNSFHLSCSHKHKTGFGAILKKVELMKTDEELEEGELDESDGEETAQSPMSPSPPISNKTSHKCSYLCNKFNIMPVLQDSPLNHPLKCGWQRSNKDGRIIYISPCGIICLNFMDIQKYLMSTKCTNLFTTNFCFLSDISTEISSMKPDFEPLYSDSDLSNGMEIVPVSFISNIGPIIKYSFHYVGDMIFDSKIYKFENELTSCICDKDCSHSCPCKLKDIHSECNNLCSCSFGCSNRVIQRGLKQCLQVIQEDTSFKVKALHDISKDSYICSITGVVRHSLPEKGSFTYPLNRSLYNIELGPVIPAKPESQLLKTEFHDKSSVFDFYHDDAKLIMSSDLESANKVFEKQLQNYSSLNPHWVRTASRHSFTSALLDPNLALSYPSIHPVRRDSNLRTKQRSSCSQNNGDLSQLKSETYLDCTEYGNVGRFIPIDENFNTEIRPVIVDSSTIPWLAVYTTSNILKDSFLVMKPFKRSE